MIYIKQSDFHHAWSLLVHDVIRGEKCVIGDVDSPHPVIGDAGMVMLRGSAIKQIAECEVHQDAPFKHIKPYVEQFTYKYWWETHETSEFAYTYFDRLANHCGIDQLDCLSDGLKTQMIDGISSNRNHAVTWMADIDSGNKNPPCLQSINVRYVGDNQADMHLYWRSRDAFTAWQSNIIAVTYMINRFVAEPNDCEIRRIYDACSHYHVYETDLAAARDIRGMGPQNQYV